MNKSKLTNYEISLAVNNAIETNGWSVRHCCDAFNREHALQIARSEFLAMDKDFIQRVRNNKFQVVTTRVSNLCDFLKVDIREQSNPVNHPFIKEFHVLENVVRQNPKLEHKLRALLSNVADVLTLNGAR
ncbi:MAG: hypothetical protein V4445_09590 [Pseudomonadota bacterium]